MKNRKKRNIFKPITSKRIAALLSASLLILPLTACKNDKKTEKPQIEIEFCDTSDIRLDTYVDKYLADYEAGTVSNGSEMFTHYEELFEILIEDPVIENEANYQNLESTNQNVTYNFNKELMNYETADYMNYYANDEIIKKVFLDQVTLKTLDGFIKIEKQDDSYIITNTDDVKSIETVLQYNSDGSYIISEERDENSDTFEFDNTGILVSSISEEYNGYSNVNKIYNNGNINVYDAYDGGENLIEKRNPDGSYMISYFNGTIDQTRYNFYPDSKKIYTKISYFYDNKNNLQKIETYLKSRYNTDEYSEDKTIFLSNGDYYQYIKYYDKDGNVYNDEKIENKYNKYRTNIINRKNETGNFDEIVTRYDYNVLSPYKDEYVVGDWIFRSVNNKIVITQNDGIIYNYDEHTGDFVKAYKVDEEGITYYQEDGKKTSFEDNKGTKIQYDKDENIKSISNGTTTISYYDYDKNIISQVSNDSDNEITVDANGKTFKLSSTGWVSFYENGNINHYQYDENTNSFYLETGEEWQSVKNGITTWYDKNHNITGMIKDGVRTDYYDYNNNVIQAIEENGIKHIYYENGNIKEIKNVNNENTYNHDGYELKKGSRLFYYENGNLKSYYYDENYSIGYYENGDEEYIDKDGKKIIYDENHKVKGVWENKTENGYSLYTGYYDYENNIIKSRQENNITTNYFENQEIESIYNYNKNGISISINDLYGNVYELKEDDYIRFYANGNVNYVSQGNIYKVFYRINDSSYYYTKDSSNNTYTFYHNNEILHTMDSSTNFGTTTFNKDGITRIVLEDGTIIDSDVQVEKTDDER